jgi:2-polyprenyl-3-methyl-5-hydroxy-6-metoxy-1,4-benzoquinol methylase
MNQEQWDELAKYGRSLDFNLKRLNETKDEIVRVQTILQMVIGMANDEMRVAVNRLSDRFNLLEQQLVKHGLPKIDYYDHEFTTVRKLAEGNQWPLAVEDIVRNDTYEIAKANNILDMIVIDNLAGKRVLDYGCGSGTLVAEIEKRDAALVVGYDIKGPSEHREAKKIFTKDKVVVANHAPYDFIILYDVLDHTEDPVGNLKFIEEISTPQTKIIVRNHPFCARHGKHLFTTLNRAFLHMFFDDMELTRLCGYTGIYTQPVLRPMIEYRRWLSHTNFETVMETPITTPVESFFTDPENYMLRDKLVAKYNGEDPTRHMQIDFVDYVLRKKNQVII